MKRSLDRLRRSCGLFALLCACLCTACRPARISSRSAPGPASQPAALFTDRAAASGLQYQWGHKDLAHVNILDAIGHGCAFFDYDGDGRLDILLVGNDGARLYHNRDGAVFEDVTARALPPRSSPAHFLGCAIADYDGDGRPDLFLTGYGCTALYHNEGEGRFRDVTQGSGLEARGAYDWTTSAAWADIDGDGRLDLYVCRYVQFTPQSRQFCGQKALDGTELQMACPPTDYASEKGSLYRNEGSGHFREITREAGLTDTHGNGLGCMFCDFNDDGRPDLSIANDRKLTDLYSNLGQGHFRNIASEAGVALGADGNVISGMGMDWGDYDNDGRFDLLAATYAGQPKCLYHNEGHELFSNRSYASGLGTASLLPLAFGADFVDVDNNGLLDIVFTNGHVDSLAERVDAATSYFQSAQTFQNLGGGRFAEASGQAGPDFTQKIVGRGIAVGDYDGDGRLDLLIVNEEGAPLLLHNESRSGNHWLSLRCLWHGSRTDAIGARVTARTGRMQQMREIRTTGSYLSANEPEAHFGLGSNSRVATLEIRWPDGHRSTYHDVPADHAYTVTPDDRAPVPLR